MEEVVDMEAMVVVAAMEKIIVMEVWRGNTVHVISANVKQALVFLEVEVTVAEVMEEEEVVEVTEEVDMEAVVTVEVMVTENESESLIKKVPF